MTKQFSMIANEGRRPQAYMNGEKITGVTRVMLDADPYNVPTVKIEIKVTNAILLDLLEAQIGVEILEILATDKEKLIALRDRLNTLIEGDGE